MGARRWALCVFAGLTVAAASAVADPKPTKVDISAIKKDLVVLKDAKNNVYVVNPSPLTDARVFFGNEKVVHEQIIIFRSSNVDAWELTTFAPRLDQLHHGSIARDAAGSFKKSCWGKDDGGLTQITGDKAKAILDKTQFLSSAIIRRAHLLARDDNGVYYYVDAIRSAYGGAGYRVFVGKRGAMKQLPLVDVANDVSGDVFSTKTGELRLVTNVSQGDRKVVWIKGEKRRDLVQLDLDVNSRLIYRDFGIYKFLGTLCDNI